MDVWYVSYGSNLCKDRFMCYINGERPPGADRPEVGCTDKTPPKASGKVEMPYALYFSKQRSKWGLGGVAFIDHSITKNEPTIGRKYLITDEQFTEVVAQENNCDFIDINFQKVMTNGFLSIGDGWYGRIVYLGELNGAPMFTFTTNEPMGNMEINTPSAAYLSTIAQGVMELGYKQDEIMDYFLNKKGIKENFTKETLKEFLRY
ncbi:hypothetical protein GMD78_17510 [Ornithinibacillus sp. L9]|uniref:Histone deacetylase n=1 Tax=Ornithinibacillus caprae TaxID=2678566 RepID=A0A6N8FLC0_9BACI|nr:hypothetical protein [Ornithinibacillus caprae]MUK90173.1 hypothetical protein [Ornithinibacillus caprae]